LWVFIGTYTQKTSKGIYRCELDLATGKLSEPVLAAETVSPSFLALHPTGRFLYAVNETANFEGTKAGAVSAFALDPATGALTFLNQLSSKGGAPCHLVVDQTGKYVLLANYTGGSVCVLPIGADGKLGEPTAFVQHEGSGGDPKRQKGPHAHSINLDAGNRIAAAADLGLDKVLLYRFDAERGTLTPNEPAFAATAPAAGPRHFAFHPDGRHAYVINEMNSTLTAFAYDPQRGSLAELQTLSTLPADFQGNNSTAEVQVHPSGKFVYGSNRGHNSIVAFAVHAATGKLKLIGHQGEGIQTPRGFGIDPTGQFLLVGSQAGDRVLVFRIDPQTGELKPTGNSVAVAVPVCVKFWPIPR
jgi:6-phosphogluconolactonase